MRSGCVQHPKDEPLIIVRQWQIEATGGDKAAAALLSFFEYWHNVKLEQSRKAAEANDVAERHQDGRPQDETLVQHHNEQQLREGAMLFGRNSLNRGIEVLEGRGFVEIVPNPNPRYSFDKTRHFVFKPGRVNEWLNHRYDPPEKDGPSVEKGSPSARKGSRSSFFDGTSPETSLEITNESTDADASGADPPDQAKPKPAPPTGGMFVRLFDGDLAGVRASYPDRQRRPLSGKWRKALKRAADEEIAAGRDPSGIRRGVSRLALRIDAYPGLELAEAINDVLDSKAWTVDQELRAKAAISGRGPSADVPRGEAGGERRKEGYAWLFGEEDPVTLPPGVSPPAPVEDVPAEPLREPEPERDPWEGSAFADVVPHDGWGDLADGKVAKAIRARLLAIAGEPPEAEYGAAVEELRKAPWVGDGFKESVIGGSADLRRARPLGEAG